MGQGSRFVYFNDVAPYHPANHSGTTNYRLVSADTVGARNVEVLVGVIAKGQGALPHSHPGIEQVCYMLEGRALAEVDGERKEIGVGDCCFFPASVEHTFTALSDIVKVLVVYSPPYNEDSRMALRATG